ncbi:MAG: efflux RND transporter permease subunit, partial [Magnetococcales bacterium]|nr:efflux RND transporter permease subunit [Magnetococcales bacterium]
MSPVHLAVKRPVAVFVAALLLMLFGALSVMRIPVQMIPDVRKPNLSVETLWPGAAPIEVENEITIPQEEALKGLSGLEKISSSASYGRSRVKLEFRLGTNMDAATVLVSNRLDRVKSLPDESSRPTLRTADSDDAPITWMRFHRIDRNDRRNIDTWRDYVEEIIQPELERIPGVALVNVYGGRKRELRVTVDPYRMAARGITLSRLVQAVRSENRDISAGQFDEGKRSYLVRSLGRLTTPEAVASIVLASGENGTVTVGDVATVAFDHEKAIRNVRGSGQPMMAMNCVRVHGGNVLEIMEDVHATVARINTTILADTGFRITVLYDQTDYIDAALELVRNNLFLGGCLAMGILLIFLRSVPATLVIALAIPVSVIGAFLAMGAMGRTVNVISLAGLAFAVGMVVDPAIVALENIVRLRDGGLSSEEAAVRGVGQVWGAILISTLTTVAVFLPILALEIEAAQLFGD